MSNFDSQMQNTSTNSSSLDEEKDLNGLSLDIKDLSSDIKDLSSYIGNLRSELQLIKDKLQLKGRGDLMDMETFLYTDYRGALFFTSNYLEYGGHDKEQNPITYPITDMSDFTIPLGYLSLEPNAYTKIKFTGLIEFDNFSHEVDNPEKSSVKVCVKDISGYDGKFFILNQEPLELNLDSNEKDIYFDYEIVIKNTVKIGNRHDIKQKVIYIYDTEKGKIEIDIYAYYGRVFQIIEELGGEPPDDFDPDLELNKIIEEDFGTFEQNIFEYPMEVETFEIESETEIKRIKDLPLRLRIITSVSNQNEYPNISINFDKQLRVDFSGIGYEFNPDNDYYTPDTKKFIADLDDFEYFE